MGLCSKTHTNIFSTQYSCEFELPRLSYDGVLHISLVYRVKESPLRLGIKNRPRVQRKNQKAL